MKLLGDILSAMFDLWLILVIFILAGLIMVSPFLLVFFLIKDIFF